MYNIKETMFRNKIKFIGSLLFLFVSHYSSADSTLHTSVTLDSANYQYIRNLYSNILQLQIDSNRTKFNKVLALAKINEDKKFLADLYNTLGDYFLRNSVSDSMLKYYIKALEVGVKIDYDHYLPDIGYKIANTYWDIGNYSQALEMALQIKNYYENKNLLDEQGPLINLIGIIYLRLLDYPTALENLKHSAKISERKKDYAFLGVTYTNIGSLYFKMNKYADAIEYYKKGVKLEVEYKEFRSAGRSYESIANMYLVLGETDRVEPLLKQALEYNSIASDIVGQLRTYSTYGKYYNYLKQYLKGIEYLRKAEELAIKSDSKEYYMNTCEQFSIAYQNVNDYKRAFYYQNKHLDLYKQIYDIQEFAEIKKLENELRIEKKNNEISKIEIEKKRSINLLLIVVIILSMALGNLFMMMYFHSVRAKKSLMKMNAEIQLQKEHLEQNNIELEEAHKLAESANQLKSHFLRNITHEIRTPLNGIVGLSEVIVNMNDSADNKQEYLQMIKDNSTKLISTIDNLVEMAHITANQVNAKVDMVNPKDFIDEIYRLFLPRFDNCKGKVAFNNFSDVNPDVFIKTDVLLLKKIIEQLIENSIKFTREGNITVGYRTNENILEFFIRDTGIGISYDSQAIVFESFRQEQENSLREFDGVGIGLTIAKKLSELLGADLWFESKKDKGTTFYLSFRQEIIEQID